MKFRRFEISMTGHRRWAIELCPKKVRRPAPDLTPADAHREGDAAPQNAVPESGQLPWNDRSDASHSSVMCGCGTAQQACTGTPPASGATAFDRREIRVGEPARRCRRINGRRCHRIPTGFRSASLTAAARTPF